MNITQPHSLLPHTVHRDQLDNGIEIVAPVLAILISPLSGSILPWLSALSLIVPPEGCSWVFWISSGIPTHVRVSPGHAFQACAFNRPAVAPDVRERTLLWRRWAAAVSRRATPMAFRSVRARPLQQRPSQRELPIVRIRDRVLEAELLPVSRAERILFPDRYQRAAIVQNAVALQAVEAPRV